MNTLYNEITIIIILYEENVQLVLRCLEKIKNFDFWFRALLKIFCLVAPSLNKFFRQEGNPMISLILVLHTLLALLSCPPFALGVTLLLTQVNFYPTVVNKHTALMGWRIPYEMQQRKGWYFLIPFYVVKRI